MGVSSWCRSTVSGQSALTFSRRRNNKVASRSSIARRALKATEGNGRQRSSLLCDCDCGEPGTPLAVVFSAHFQRGNGTVE